MADAFERTPVGAEGRADALVIQNRAERSIRLNGLATQ
jgi:hypothetical protein